MKEIPLEELEALINRLYHAERGEISTLTIGITIDCIEEYDFTNIKERLLQRFQAVFDEQNRLGQI
ncbi:hypothetical protein CVIC8964_1325 [Campylobacter vicugnae]|uniref:Uncharacterized protein n=1 Tax=Campylobacter vicugnae TaxID=1660076 RepID=A0A1X9T2F0_9BACT|nr:hypothetical protein [Campylobacter sp. RM8964]ARR02714.1 hypothetical protein CVIC8964_1325 [Campylobacter sp. RM8964]